MTKAQEQQILEAGNAIRMATAETDPMTFVCALMDAVDDRPDLEPSHLEKIGQAFTHRAWMMERAG